MEAPHHWMASVPKRTSVACHTRHPHKVLDRKLISLKYDIRTLIEGPLQHNEDQLTIQEVLNNGHDTSLATSFELPPALIEKINSVYLPFNSIRPDCIIWGLSPIGQFTVSSCYKVLTHSTQFPNLHGWIWRLNLPPKIKSFLWLISHNRLPTNSYLHRLGILSSNLCTLCQVHKEQLAIFYSTALTQDTVGRP